MRNKKSKKNKRLQVKNKSNFDVFGSYTGVDIFDEDSKPVQDADDL